MQLAFDPTVIVLRSTVYVQSIQNLGRKCLCHTFDPSSFFDEVLLRKKIPTLKKCSLHQTGQTQMQVYSMPYSRRGEKHVKLHRWKQTDPVLPTIETRVMTLRTVVMSGVLLSFNQVMEILIQTYYWCQKLKKKMLMPKCILQFFAQLERFEVLVALLIMLLFVLQS